MKHIDPRHDQNSATPSTASPRQAHKHNRTNTSRAGIPMPTAVPLAGWEG